MTTIGPSQGFKDLIADAKKAKGDEAANIINQPEANAIKEKLLEETKGLSEADTKQYVQETEKLLKSEFTGTNVSSQFTLTDGSQDIKNPTTFSFNIKGQIKTEKPAEPPIDKVVADGKDFNKSEKEALITTPEGQKIIKRYEYLAADSNRTLTGKPELNAASKEDLKGLRDSFGEDAGKFLAALKSNPAFSTATLNDAETILKFAKDGCNTEKDVIDLQKALKNIGPDLKARFEKNGKDLGFGKGIDKQYGFATMEGVRYLSAVAVKQQPQPIIETKDISAEGQGLSKDTAPPTKNVITWVIGCDSSSSMAPKLKMYGKLFSNEEMFHKEARYTIGESQDFNEKVNVLTKKSDLDKASSVMNNEKNFKSNDKQNMTESGVTQLYKMIDGKGPLKDSQKPAGLMIVTDANEQAAFRKDGKNVTVISKLIDEAKKQGYSQITIAALEGEKDQKNRENLHDGTNRSHMITINLEDPKSLEAFTKNIKDWDSMAENPYLKQTGAVKVIDYKLNQK